MTYYTEGYEKDEATDLGRYIYRLRLGQSEVIVKVPEELVHLWDRIFSSLPQKMKTAETYALFLCAAHPCPNPLKALPPFTAWLLDDPQEGVIRCVQGDSLADKLVRRAVSAAAQLHRNKSASDADSDAVISVLADASRSSSRDHHYVLEAAKAAHRATRTTRSYLAGTWSQVSWNAAMAWAQIAEPAAKEAASAAAARGLGSVEVFIASFGPTDEAKYNVFMRQRKRLLLELGNLTDGVLDNSSR
jgi:hypothetical protein